MEGRNDLHGCWGDLSLFVPSEARHKDVQQWYDANKEPLITTDYCVDELLTLLVARKRSALVLAVGWRLLNEQFCRVLFLTPEQVRRAWVVFQTKHSLGWSFTDCTSKVLIDELGIQTAASLDQHFRQFGNLQIVP
jgi:predicted nucleic acid-binding protein